MYSSYQLAKKYLRYYASASNGRGHGIHSPFVFEFVTQVLNDRRLYPCYKKIEPLRATLLANNAVIDVEDFGAGSAMLSSSKKTIRSIAKASLKNKKFAQLLFRIVGHYKPQTIVELGTSFGITTCYLACEAAPYQVITFEGSAAIAAIAKENFKKAGCENISLIQGSFDKTLSNALAALHQVDLAFVDGNHRKLPTLQYFFILLQRSTPASIFIFDDIHWSNEMEKAWEDIRQHPSVTLTIDLFFIGLVFFNTDLKVKQHFSVRF
jgi:predicted O-methyltransferase YrrM